MESNQPLDSNFEEGLHLTGQSLDYLKETAKWAKFLAIVGFVIIGLSASVFIGMVMLMGSYGYNELGGEEAAIFGAVGLVSSIFYTMVFIAIYFMPLLFLYRFGARMQAALRSQDNDTFQSALGNIKSHYKYIGILIIIFLVFYGLALLMVVFGGIAALM